MKKKRKSKFHQVFVRIIVPSHTCKMVLLKKKSEDKIEVSPSHPCLPDAFLKTNIFDIVEQQNNQVEAGAGYSVKHFVKYTSKNHTLYGLFGTWRKRGKTCNCLMVNVKRGEVFADSCSSIVGPLYALVN